MKKVFLLAALSISTSLFAQPPNYVPTNGLIGWYPFNNNALDSSDNGNNGTLTGATTTNDRFGQIRSAYRFFNSSDKIELQTVSANRITKYTVTGWFQINPGSSNFDGTIFAHSNACNGSDGLRLFFGQDNLLYWRAEYTSGCAGKGARHNRSYEDDNSWHFFTVTLDADSGLLLANQFKIYIDTVLVSNPADSISSGDQNAVIAPILNGTSSTTIGNINIGGAQFRGKLDDIGIWERVLSPSEIKNIFLSKTQTASIPQHPQKLEILIHPNPAQGTLKIVIGKHLLNTEFEIYSIQGKIVFRGHLSELTNEVDISSLLTGSYILRTQKDAANYSIFKL